MARFADIANKKLADVAPAPLPPTGFYVMEVSNNPTVTERKGANGDFEIIDFPLRGIASHEDVDMDELNTYGGAKNVSARLSFMFNNDPAEEVNFQKTENRLKRFLEETLGISEDEAADFKTAFGMVKGRRLIAEIGHRPDRDRPDEFYTEIKKTMPLE